MQHLIQSDAADVMHFVMKDDRAFLDVSDTLYDQEVRADMAYLVPFVELRLWHHSHTDAGAQVYYCPAKAPTAVPYGTC